MFLCFRSRVRPTGCLPDFHCCWLNSFSAVNHTVASYTLADEGIWVICLKKSNQCQQKQCFECIQWGRITQQKDRVTVQCCWYNLKCLPSCSSKATSNINQALQTQIFEAPASFDVTLFISSACTIHRCIGIVGQAENIIWMEGQIEALTLTSMMQWRATF